MAFFRFSSNNTTYAVPGQITIVKPIKRNQTDPDVSDY